MKLNRREGIQLVALAAILITSGCWRHDPPRVYPDRPDPRAGEIAIELYDANKDGFLEGRELDKVPGLKEAIERVDSNHDGKISAEDISADPALERRQGRPHVGQLPDHSHGPAAARSNRGSCRRSSWRGH